MQFRGVFRCLFHIFSIAYYFVFVKRSFAVAFNFFSARKFRVIPSYSNNEQFSQKQKNAVLNFAFGNI